MIVVALILLIYGLSEVFCEKKVNSFSGISNVLYLFTPLVNYSLTINLKLYHLLKKIAFRKVKTSIFR